MSARARVGLILAVVLTVWLAAGLLRAGTVANDYFAHAHGPGATVVNVTVDTVMPAVPPFWAVNISGDVIEARSTSPVYRSVMSLWVEPVTGWVIVFAAG